MSRLRVRMRAPADAEQVRPLVAAARAVLASVLGEVDVSNDLELVAAELLNNAVEHGSGDPGDEIELALEVDADRVLMSVSNAGAADACFVPRAEPSLPEELAEGGYGRFLVHQLVDEVNYACEGQRTIVTCVKRLAPGPEGTP